MRKDTSGSTARRTFLKYSLVSTSTLVGTSSTGAAAETPRDPAGPADRTVERGVMRAYQYIPNSRVTVRDAVDRQPSGLEDAFGYVVAYDAAPSLQALLFTTADGGGGESDSRPLQSGDSLSLGGVQDAPSDASRRYVTVGVEQ
ncbi:hypothetical protein [Haloterrigena alkaliphila]|uniref:Uncharacterized protein n=1 Tax=Haloterrigena alkaliphila TaxID=2816475 RepID=A0A8A2VA27_9EURY|nr:hypothetical protein [Haloterrigena alkaliphila]QSW98889.1 hypothetical protein J0X25_16110 [Haloterrigena alkaliphila]